MSAPNYFEILCITTDPASVTDDMVAESKEKARQHWQTIDLQYGGDEGRQAKRNKAMIEEAYEAINSADKRKAYIERLARSSQRASSEQLGDIQVRFSLGGEHGHLNFNVVENPVTHPLSIGHLSMRSIQEFICRAWEKPDEVGLPVLDDRSLERWLYYSAREADISDAIRYYQWRSDNISEEQLLFQALDLLQSRYPAPILPRSETDVLEKIKTIAKPHWLISPAVANFGFLSGGKNTITLSVRAWKKPAGKLKVTVDNPLIRLDTSAMDSKGVIVLELNGSDVKAGQTIQAAVTMTSETFGEKIVPVYGMRMKWLGIKMFNQGLVHDHTKRVAAQSLELDEHDYAAELYREIGDLAAAQKADLRSLTQSHEQHQWLAVIEKSRQFQSRYGRDPQITMMVVEALRMIGATYYQLKQDQPALPYLATLSLESARLPNGKLPDDNWTRKPEAQIDINPDRPQEAWVEVAEKLDLRWSHPGGTADRSHFAGDRPLSLQDRMLYWRSDVTCKPPLVAYLGVIVARRRDEKAMVALDVASGKKLWEHKFGQRGGREYSEPVCGKGCVFFTDPMGILFALDIQTGKERWQYQLGDVRDLQLAYMEDTIIVATGAEVVLIDAKQGTMKSSTGKLRGLFAGANPVNLLISDDCVMFQKATMFNKTMNFIDTKMDQNLEFKIPFGLVPPVTWAAYEGELYMPFVLSYQGRVVTGTSIDSNGREYNEYETVYWREVSMKVFDVHSDKPIADYQIPFPGKVYYKHRDVQDIKMTAKSADLVALAPVHIEQVNGTTLIAPHDPDHHMDFIVAATFDKEVCYWVSLAKTIEIANVREAESEIQSIIFANIQDIVISKTSFSAALIGQEGGEFGASWRIPKELGSIKGTPALYGDVIYVISGSDQIVAIGK